MRALVLVATVGSLMSMRSRAAIVHRLVISTSVIGSMYDIVGAVVLIRALIWARPLELFRLAVRVWDADAEMLRSQCTQKVDALWGSSILIVGFAFQALAALGLSIGVAVAALLLAMLVALYAAFHFWLRAKNIRSWYMRAVDAATCEQSVKDAVRSAF
jgi:hypothetical protein